MEVYWIMGETCTWSFVRMLFGMLVTLLNLLFRRMWESDATSSGFHPCPDSHIQTESASCVCTGIIRRSFLYKWKSHTSVSGADGFTFSKMVTPDVKQFFEAKACKTSMEYWLCSLYTTIQSFHWKWNCRFLQTKIAISLRNTAECCANTVQMVSAGIDLHLHVAMKDEVLRQMLIYSAKSIILRFFRCSFVTEWDYVQRDCSTGALRIQISYGLV